MLKICHDDVIKWRNIPRFWPFVRGIHRSPVNSPRKGQWRGALMFLWSAPWINGWVNNRKAGDLRCLRAHYDVIVTAFRHMSWKYEVCGYHMGSQLYWDGVVFKCIWTRQECQKIDQAGKRFPCLFYLAYCICNPWIWKMAHFAPQTIKN